MVLSKSNNNYCISGCEGVANSGEGVMVCNVCNELNEKNVPAFMDERWVSMVDV